VVDANALTKFLWHVSFFILNRYADEDSSFALELTYNYSVKKYNIGNDFNSITICKKDAFYAAKCMVKPCGSSL
jgi:hypothetical protein